MSVMSGRCVARIAASAAILATGLAVSGCTASGPDGGGTEARATRAAASTGSTAGVVPAAPGATTPVPDATAPASSAPSSPRPRVTPAPDPGEPGGPSAAAQKQYVAVVGTDQQNAASVLDAGSAICDRVSYTGQVDSGALVTAIASGEIANAATAIPLLCPTYVPQLAAAKHGFSDGTTKVAKAFAPGQAVTAAAYTAAAASKDCHWVVYKGDTVLVSGKARVKADGSTVASVDVPRGATSVTSDGCRVWLPAG